MDVKEFKIKFKLLEQKVQDLSRLEKELDDFSQIIDLRTKRNEENTKKIIDEYLMACKSDVTESIQLMEKDKAFFISVKEDDRQALINIFGEKSIGFPWLAKAYSDYIELRDEEIAHYLEDKDYPALKAAEVVRITKSEKRQVEKEFRIAKYILQYYEDLFPWLIEFRGEDLDDLIRQTLEQNNRKRDFDEEIDDPAKKWLTLAEFHNLSPAEKYQLALDRYRQKRKGHWQIGRDYERYIGYLYEKEGYKVHYQGIVEGLEDLGRDLICIKGNMTKIVQCKCWSHKKAIHEKHINQLFGTTVMYWIKTEGGGTVQLELFPDAIRKRNIIPVFVTSTKLSPSAKEFSKALGVEIRESFPLSPYPSIKCNVARKDGERIYHLPFDQQYDKTIIEHERNECYVETVAEAEALGFRRAFRWRGSKNELT